MEKIKILWADDEIDLLRPHVLYLQERGFVVTTVTNGEDAVEEFRDGVFDIVFLDENMPGLTGLETLAKIKHEDPGVPIVMITKSEEENIMEGAIGGKIADYLIKPVNPTQILLTIKKNVQSREIINRKVTSGYQQAFMNLTQKINEARSYDDWQEVYKDLVFWEIELESGDNAMDEIMKMQKTDANSSFAKFIKKEYLDWFSPRSADRPLMSQDLMKQKVLPLLDNGEKVFLIVIDNLRFDQWRALRPILSEYFTVDEEELYYSILPTATQYARNAIFAGLLPTQIKQYFPDFWIDEDEEEGKNIHEEDLIRSFLDRHRRNFSFSYNKILDNNYGIKVLNQIKSLEQNDLNVIVFNFVDFLSHTRTESKAIKELASDEAAYRALAISWFNHSAAIDIFKALAERNVKVVLTTDHGSIRVQNAIKVVGDKNTNTNLRYKTGKNLAYTRKEVFEINNPQEVFLPSMNISSKYVFAQSTDFFAYPNNYNHYVSYYKDTFQHGGISLEEMLIPLVTLKSKKF